MNEENKSPIGVRSEMGAFSQSRGDSMEYDKFPPIVIDATIEAKPSCWGNLKTECDGQCKHYKTCVDESVRRDINAGRD